MIKFNTQGIVLARINYGEADRIITFLTPDNGKIKVMAKGVRKQKSKLAGGIELFSISDIGVLAGRSEINTLASSRLVKHYGNIIKDLDRTNLTYELIKRINKATEDYPEAAYFDLLEQAFETLNDNSIDLNLVEVWFNAQLLRMAGHSPNLRTEKSGEKLQANKKYDFNYEAMYFQAKPKGSFDADKIKFLRLLFSNNQTRTLQKLQGVKELTESIQPMVQSILQAHIRI